MKFAPVYRNLRIFSGFDFELKLPVRLKTGANAQASDLSGYTFHALIKRSDDHSDDDYETFEPTVTLTGSTLVIAGDEYQTQILRAGHMLLIVWATQGAEKSVVARCSIHVEGRN